MGVLSAMSLRTERARRAVNLAETLLREARAQRLVEIGVVSMPVRLSRRACSVNVRSWMHRTVSTRARTHGWTSRRDLTQCQDALSRHLPTKLGRTPL